MKFSKIAVVAVALVVAVVSFASVAGAANSTFFSDLYRVKNVAGTLTPDSASFTIEQSAAATLPSNDTLSAVYVGDLNAFYDEAATNAAKNVLRVVVRGVPTDPVADTLRFWCDWSNSPHGPWYTEKNTVTPQVVCLNGLGAANADTAGVGTWRTYGYGPTYGSNSVIPTPNVYTGFMQINNTLASISAGGINSPQGWQYLRLRSTGDHGGAGTVLGATVSVSYLIDLAAQITPRKH